MSFSLFYDPVVIATMAALAVAFLLGMVHGITPDEHTWPITFSYAIGTHTRQGGMKSGLIFSSGFTLQRSILSELAYFALIGLLTTVRAMGLTYMAVGIAMAAAGIYIAKKSRYPHFHWIERNLNRLFRLHKHGSEDENLELSHERNPMTVHVHNHDGQVPGKLAFTHGIIAGFGTGAFALIIYTVLAPSMPSPYIGFLPGTMFGLGTMVMQVLIGAFFGTMLTKKKHLSKEGIAYVSKSISMYVLTYGGAAFVLGGIMVLLFPQILGYNLITPVAVHNLHELGLGFILVIVSVVIVGMTGYVKAMKDARKFGYVDVEE